jgi:hypothetical protein
VAYEKQMNKYAVFVLQHKMYTDTNWPLYEKNVINFKTTKIREKWKQKNDEQKQKRQMKKNAFVCWHHVTLFDQICKNRRQNTITNTKPNLQKVNNRITCI